MPQALIAQFVFRLLEKRRGYYSDFIAGLKKRGI